ncbi:hypothetical protein B0T25DRAFT_292372 [Lasiosphaeria hispida]|uniref:Uncharacterized protein n=1 Tax=Lasiosphaeria hispida TaxID=260671 RepID=A0AAJ0HCB3_9PEZI|nr:hypothetical protein B0T25DRAFT_292372 [Lasiosphaeria hispida]
MPALTRHPMFAPARYVLLLRAPQVRYICRQLGSRHVWRESENLGAPQLGSHNQIDWSNKTAKMATAEWRRHFQCSAPLFGHLSPSAHPTAGPGLRQLAEQTVHSMAIGVRIASASFDAAMRTAVQAHFRIRSGASLIPSPGCGKPKPKSQPKPKILAKSQIDASSVIISSVPFRLSSVNTYSSFQLTSVTLAAASPALAPSALGRGSGALHRQRRCENGPVTSP